MFQDGTFFKQSFLKPDGRRIFLYGVREIQDVGPIPSPRSASPAGGPHFRWNPLRGEWVSFASFRQDRTYMPPPEYDPLLPWSDPTFPTELPTGDYEVAVFDNLFPSMKAHQAALPGAFEDLGSRPTGGACEVVVFSQDPTGSLGTQTTERIELILRVWADRTRELSRDPAIRLVMPFENKGVEMGVTLPHPHGQIYAYPLVPPIPAIELENQKRFHQANGGSNLLASMVRKEIASGERLVFENEHTVAFVPEAARLPYEVWLMPKESFERLDQLDSETRLSLAQAMKSLLTKFDRLWGRPFPYLMVVYQAPVNSGSMPWAHLHIKFLPPLRSPDRLKYLAGTELGAGLYANDCLPETTARALREIAP